jgi:hypothetical protein
MDRTYNIYLSNTAVQWLTKGGLLMQGHSTYHEADSKEKIGQQTQGINVTLRRVRVTIVAVEKQSILHILSVCL